MRFLVLGAHGMAGHLIALYLQEQGYEVVGFARKEIAYLEEVVKGDAFNLASLEYAIEYSKADVVINAIGILNNDAEMYKSAAVYLNSYLPHKLADMLKDSKSRVFQISTDCVFKGNTGPYREDSVPDGMSYYDKTKALGELNDSKNLTFRQSIIGPDINSDGIGLLNWFMKQENTIRGYTGAIWTGLSTLELAKAIEATAKQDVAGLVNMVPEMSITKFDLLVLFSKYLRQDELLIEACEDVSIDKTLIRTNYDVGYRPLSYESQIEELADWMRNHRRLYGHYKNLA